MEEKSAIDNLITHARDYAEERMRLIVLTLHEKVSRAVSGLASALLLLILGVFIALFLSLGFAWWIGKQLQEPFLGFMIVAAVYLLIAVIIYANREKWIRMPVINIFLRSVADEED